MPSYSIKPVCLHGILFLKVHQGPAYEEAHSDRRKIMETMADGKLTGQVALITGASSGIGGAIARAFLNEGADLVVVARRQERLQAMAEEALKGGRRCVVVEGDVREEETAVRAVQAAVQQLGQLDILVNNAGIGRYADLVQTSADDYDAMMDTNMSMSFQLNNYVFVVILK